MHFEVKIHEQHKLNAGKDLLFTKFGHNFHKSKDSSAKCFYRFDYINHVLKTPSISHLLSAKKANKKMPNDINSDFDGICNGPRCLTLLS